VNQESSLVLSVFNFRCLYLSFPVVLLLQALLQIHSVNRLLDSDVQRCLTKLVKHKQMVWELIYLGLKALIVRIESSQLMNSCISVIIHPIIMWVNKIALDAREGFLFNTCKVNARCSWSHGWLLSVINELSDDEYSQDCQVFEKHNDMQKHRKIG